MPDGANDSQWQRPSQGFSQSPASPRSLCLRACMSHTHALRGACEGGGGVSSGGSPSITPVHNDQPWFTAGVMLSCDNGNHALNMTILRNAYVYQRKNAMSMPSNNTATTNREGTGEEADSTTRTTYENHPAYLDTIAEEEEYDHSSVSCDTSDNCALHQHLTSPNHEPTLGSELLEAQYFVGECDSIEWMTNNCPPPTTKSPLSSLEIFPVQFEEKDILPANNTTYTPLVMSKIYLDKSGSKSLPSMPKAPSSTVWLQRNMSASNICVMDDLFSLANSKAPSPTKTQLHDVAEWALSSPGVTTTTDTFGGTEQTSSPLAVRLHFSVETEADTDDAVMNELLDAPTGRMKRSPAVEGVSVLLEKPSSLLAEISPIITEKEEARETSSPRQPDSISLSESYSSSPLSLSQRYCDSPGMPARPVYDYGTDETLLEIFMTPAVGSDWEKLDVDCSKTEVSTELLKSLGLTDSSTALVWRDTCDTVSDWLSQSNCPFGNADDLPFIDNEESYSETWYITASQQFSWIERAQLADFDEIAMLYGNSSEHLSGDESGRKSTNHLIKTLFTKKHRNSFQKIRSPKTPGKKGRLANWFNSLCGCVSRSHVVL